MNIGKVLILTILMSCWLFNSGFEKKTSIPKDLVNAISSGDSRKLSLYFDDTIELTLLKNRANVYSKFQAEQIMNEFFTSNQPNHFEILNEGNDDKTLYAIGEFNSFTGNYRIYFKLKTNKDKFLIQSLKVIEKIS